MGRSPTLLVEDEHDRYPVHEEDSVPETPRHYWQAHYLVGALKAHYPDLWVTSDTCLYWERGNTRRYVAPDVAVIDGPPPAEPPNVYLAWSDPPLRFVGEIGSRSTLQADTGPKVRTYERDLKVPEYLYADPPKGDLRLWRMIDGAYHLVAPEPDGRVWSAQLSLRIGFDEEGFLRFLGPGDEPLLTHEETQRLAESETRRADSEARRARAEARQAQTQARRADTEAQRADAEAQGRAEAERQLAEIRAQLERLRAERGA